MEGLPNLGQIGAMIWGVVGGPVAYIGCLLGGFCSGVGATLYMKRWANSMNRLFPVLALLALSASPSFAQAGWSNEGYGEQPGQYQRGQYSAPQQQYYINPQQFQRGFSSPLSMGARPVHRNQYGVLAVTDSNGNEVELPPIDSFMATAVAGIQGIFGMLTPGILTVFGLVLGVSIAVKLLIKVTS